MSWVRAFVCLSLLFSAAAVEEKSALAQPGREDSAKAEAAIKRGLELREAGREDQALAEFERAYALAPTPRAAAQLGLCKQALGRWSEADAHLLEALEAKKDPWIRKYRATLDEAVTDGRRNMGQLEVLGEPDGAEVIVAGRTVGTLPLKSPVRVNVGVVDVEVRASGHRPTTRSLSMAAGQYQKIVVRLEPSAATAPPAVASALPAAPAPTSTEPTDLGLAASSTPTDEAPRPFYKRAWFWGTVAGVVALGVVGAIVLSSGETFPTVNGQGTVE